MGTDARPSAGSGQALHKQLPKSKTPHEQESLLCQIAATDKQIDAVVNELYGGFGGHSK